MKRHATDRPTNAISFDLEHWYTATLLRENVTDPADRVGRSVRIVLELLDEFDTTATFFVVGEVAAEYPELIRTVAADGHEIASHGHTHRPVSELSRDAFRTELQRSAEAIRRAVGERPVGFRAPNFSITDETRWAFAELRETGYRYDSSVFPVRTPMYGVSGAPIRPYAVDSTDPFSARRADAGGFYEVPVAVLDPRVRLPIAGGFYGRLLPTRLLTYGIRRLNERGIPATLYFHPWEFNAEVVRRDVPFGPRFVSFHGIDGLRSKLETLLSTFEFGTVGGLLDRELAAEVELVGVEG